VEVGALPADQSVPYLIFKAELSGSRGYTSSSNAFVFLPIDKLASLGIWEQEI
jgi:hypothetical protein